MSTLLMNSRPLPSSDAAQGPDVADDATLVVRAQHGDQGAFTSLVERYSGKIWSLVSGMLRNAADTEDAVQESFFKAYRKLGEFEGKASFYTWLYRIAVNTATDHLKRRRSKVKAIDDLPGFDPVAAEAAPGHTSERGELRRRLAEAMADLPDKYRDILVLREYEECSYEEIAQTLGIAIGTVESRLFRARARLHEKLKKYLG